MVPKQVCSTGGVVATHPASNIDDLPVHRIGNVCFSRWELDANERDAVIANGSILIGMVTGRSGPFPIAPFVTEGYGEVAQEELTNMVRQMGNGLNPEMFEPNGDESELILVHLTRRTWRLFMGNVMARLQSEKDPIDRLILGTMGMIERQMNHSHALGVQPDDAKTENIKSMIQQRKD